MGLLLVSSIAAMTSFMTMVQLIALTLTLPLSPAPQAKVSSEGTEFVSVKSHTKKNGKVVSPRSATHGTAHPCCAWRRPRFQRIAPEEVTRLKANLFLRLLRLHLPALHGQKCLKAYRKIRLATGQTAKRGTSSRCLDLPRVPQLAHELVIASLTVNT